MVGRMLDRLWDKQSWIIQPLCQMRTIRWNNSTVKIPKGSSRRQQILQIFQLEFIQRGSQEQDRFQFPRRKGWIGPLVLVMDSEKDLKTGLTCPILCMTVGRVQDHINLEKVLLGLMIDEMLDLVLESLDCTTCREKWNIHVDIVDVVT